MPSKSAARTLVCSHLCIEIIDYAVPSSADQLFQKQQFNIALSGALAGIAARDRIVLEFLGETAVVFLGDPEDALKVALRVRGALREPATSDRPAPSVRFGINHGPIRLIRDINGQLNVIGDGLIVARTITKFAKSQQILVSRSFHDVVVLLFERLAGLFDYQGIRIDQDQREHEVFAAPLLGWDSIRPIIESGLALRRQGKGARWPGAASAWFRKLFR